MAISDATLRATTLTWSVTLVVAGVTIPCGDDLPGLSLGFNQQRSTCRVPVVAFPGVSAGDDAALTLTCNGESDVIFTGIVDSIDVRDEPEGFAILLIDALGLLSTNVPSDIVWSSTTITAAVTSLFDAADLPVGKRGTVHDPGSDYVLGPNYAIVIKKGTSVQDALDTLMTFGGTKLIVGTNGTINVIDYPAWPETTPTRTYAYNADVPGGEFGTLGAGRTLGGTRRVVASFKAYGPRRPDMTIPDATFTVSGASGEAIEESYEWIQTNECASAIAEREIVRRNRQSTEVSVDAVLHPTLKPGDSLYFRSSSCGYATNTPAIVLGVTSNHDTMTLLLSVGARPADGEITLIPPPDADFTAQYEQQPVSVAGIMATRTVVQFADASSDPSGFTITSRAWTFACSGEIQPSPSSSSETDPLVIYPALDGATATLVVESSSGEGDTETKNIAPTDPERFLRSLALAAGGDGLRVLTPEGWRGFDPGGSCTAVPQINDQGPLFAGFANGDLYKIDDYLATTPEVLHSFGASISCISVNEGNPQHILVAAGSTLYYSTDGGEAWATVYDFVDDITYCEQSPVALGEMRVCAGNTLYITYNGADFAALVTGEAGSTARKVASAAWGHLVVFSGVLDIADAWAFEEAGYTIDWSGVTDPPLDLAAVTPWQYTEGYIVASGGGAQDLVRDGLFGQLTYAATTALGVRLFKVTQASAGAFAAEEITTTTDSGALKVVNHGSAFPIDTPTSVFRIGYGQAQNPAAPGEILLLPSGVSGAGDYLWWHKADLGWTPVALPVAGAAWSGLVIRPTNPNEWIIWSANAAYWTGTAGADWTQIYCPDPSSGLQGRSVRAASWNGDGSTWCLSVGYTAVYGRGRSDQAYVAFGTGPNNSYQTTYGSHIKNPAPVSSDFILATLLLPGYGDELVGYATTARTEFPAFNPGLATQVCLASTSTQTVTDAGESAYVPRSRYGLSGRAYLATWGTNVGYTANYNAALPVGVISAGSSVAWCGPASPGRVFACGGVTGIVEILNITGAASTQYAAGGDDTYVRIVSGSRYRGVAAHTASRVTTFDGAQWASLDVPATLTAIGAIALREVS
jgi:hypothetical protein